MGNRVAAVRLQGLFEHGRRGLKPFAFIIELSDHHDHFARPLLKLCCIHDQLLRFHILDVFGLD